MELARILSPSPSLTLHFPRIPIVTLRKPATVLPCISHNTVSSFSTEQDVIKAVVESDGNNLPCVRTYENDLSRLRLVGAVAFEQAVTAAAADGGRTAVDHLSSGAPAMVVETFFPGANEDSATVSTRLVSSVFLLPVHYDGFRAKCLQFAVLLLIELVVC